MSTPTTAAIPTASQQEKEEEPIISKVDSHHFDTKWLVVSQVSAFVASFLMLVIDPYLFDPPMIMCSVAMIILLIPCCCRNKFVLYLAVFVTGAISLLSFINVVGAVIDCFQNGCFDDDDYDDDYHGDDQAPHDDQAYDDDNVVVVDDDYDPDDDQLIFFLFVSMLTASAFLWAISSYCMVCFARSGGIMQSRGRASSPDEEKNKKNHSSEDYQLLASSSEE